LSYVLKLCGRFIQTEQASAGLCKLSADDVEACARPIVSVLQTSTYLDVITLRDVVDVGRYAGICANPVFLCLVQKQT
jgi:hypothetical protein